MDRIQDGSHSLTRGGVALLGGHARAELAAQFAGVFGSEKQGAAFHTEIQVGLLGTSGEITPSAAASSSGVDVSLRRIVREFLS